MLTEWKMNVAESNVHHTESVSLRNALLPWLPLLLLPVGALSARWILAYGWYFPPCLLRKFTGIPCPSCGCTRSLAAWTHFDFEQALLFNPLFFALCVAMLIWFAARVAESISHRRFLPNLRLAFQGWPVWKIGAGLLALNWLYLFLALPK